MMKFCIESGIKTLTFSVQNFELFVLFCLVANNDDDYGERERKKVIIIHHNGIVLTRSFSKVFVKFFSFCLCHINERIILVNFFLFKKMNELCSYSGGWLEFFISVTKVVVRFLS